MRRTLSILTWAHREGEFEPSDVVSDGSDIDISGTEYSSDDERHYSPSDLEGIPRT